MWKKRERLRMETMTSREITKRQKGKRVRFKDRGAPHEPVEPSSLKVDVELC
ncbi:unnamed protein product [Paramecium octaurelia]|uniref:Uncharacterized protein n=1 Tax=Paramecium octaurelia TaxID=43137 RepID=A0A8S1XRQ8_PAROT|nr:unnamed protein product [Paramecium octaurelia]